MDERKQGLFKNRRRKDRFFRKEDERRIEIAIDWKNTVSMLYFNL
jgi:hypothetical protein